MRIFRQIIKYMFSSMASWGVDYGVYILMLLLPWRLPEEICHIVARVCSSLLNYKINQKAVFHARTGKREFVLYVLMVAVTLSIGTPLLTLLTRWGLNALVAKICVDTVMFFFNYLVQREIIFRRK